MNKIIINPLDGISILENNISKNIHLLLLKSEVNNILWEPESSVDWKDFYLNNCLQIFYSNDNRLEYIEISYPINYDVIFSNISIFKTKADDLLKLVTEKYKYDDKKPELWNSYIFPDIELSLRRENKPEDFDEDLWESDYEKWIHFNTIWIWKKGYYSLYK